MAASPGFAPGPPASETGALLITPRGIRMRSAECGMKTKAGLRLCPSIPHFAHNTPRLKWSPEKELHPQHLFVGET